VGLRRRGCRWIIWADGAYRRSWREERRRTRGLRGGWLQPTPTENASTSSRQGAEELRDAGPRVGERAATDVSCARFTGETVRPTGPTPQWPSHMGRASRWLTSRAHLAALRHALGHAVSGKKENGPKVRARPK
jgi:hypothetical protein